MEAGALLIGIHLRNRIYSISSLTQVIATSYTESSTARMSVAVSWQAVQDSSGVSS